MAAEYLDLLFTPSHEWARPGRERVRVGITDYAQREMGDFVFAELPSVGSRIDRGDDAGSLESVKAVSEYFAPVTCVVSRINEDLADRPDLLNLEPYGDGWLFEADVVDQSEFTALLNFIGYKATVLEEIEHIIYLDEANVLHYLPAVRGEDGRIIVGGREFESSVTAALVSARAYAGREVIEEFEYLINKSGLREQELQEFFERHPDFLLGAEYASLHPQVVLKDTKDDALIPDFILKPLAGVSYGPKIVEIKLPAQEIVKARPRREGVYANIHEAIAQLRAYARFFDEQENREYVQKVLGFTAYRPRLALIVGKDITLADERVKADILASIQPVELLTYNDLLERYRRLVTARH